MNRVNCCVKILFMLLCIRAFTSCNAMLSSPLEIVSWNPGGDIAAPSEIEEISLSFNREPEPVSTEAAFSFTSEGVEPPGRICIEGTVLTFSPYYPLKDNTGYEIILTTSAEDVNGNSLIEDFHIFFRTGEQGSRPVVVSTAPADDEEIDNQYRSIVVTFDQPVDSDSILAAFSISPSITGISLLDSDGKSFTFNPVEKWKWQQEYTVELSTALESIHGYALSEDYSFSFTVGIDHDSPEISTAASVDGSITLYDSPPESTSIQVNTGWDKDQGLRFFFSEEIDQSSAESAVTIEPDIDFEVEFDNGISPSEMIISFDTPLLWHELYKITVSTTLKDLQDNSFEDPYTYYIYIDAPSSEPLSISRVELATGGGTAFRIYDDEIPASGIKSHELLDTSGGDVTTTPYFFDYYFNLADGAELPFFGFVENFLISPDDSCISVNYLDFQIFNPGESLAAAALPVPTPDADQAVARLITSLTDDSEQSGQILLQVYSDLTDSLGNSMSEDWTAELFDEDS